MRLVRDVMSHRILYVTREATVRSAVELIRVHQAEVVPVVHEGTVVGLIDALQLTLFDGEVSVTEACVEPLITVEPETPLAEAARLMRSHRLRQVPVVRGGALVGLLSSRDLLRVWGQVNDSLTALPVQHQLRDWVSHHLSSGTEVVVLFLDLNDFGVFNKRHGHVFGDRVLQGVADALRDTVDPETDFASRMGGDEFCVATTRSLAEAHQLAVRIRDRISRISIEKQSVEIGVSIGLTGGRRTSPRAGVHTDAMLDDLITRASTASTAAKKLPERIHAYDGKNEEPAPAPRLSAGERSPGTRVVVEGYRIGQAGRCVEVAVSLRAGDTTQESRVTAARSNLNSALATATAQCLRQFAAAPVEIEVEDTYEFTTPHGIACVGATVSLTRPGESPERLVGAAPIREDAHRGYIKAILDATNRRLTAGR
jgi:diguanylate cyclase (GGDEF)-like protein